MKTIKTPSIIDEQNYLFLCKVWDENDDIWVDSSELTISEDIVKYANLAFAFPNENFTPVILGEIAEKKQTPMVLLKKIILFGDQGAIESVCMRTDLNEDLECTCNSLKLQHEKKKV